MPVTREQAQIDAHTRRLDGPLDEALRVVYGDVFTTLSQAGHDETAADQLARRIVTRVEDHLQAAGLVSRQIHDTERTDP